ncbi:MAG: putative Ig domain-containing protein [Candidatus Sulfobium sp.]|jgi:hypothetical protein
MIAITLGMMVSVALPGCSPEKKGDIGIATDQAKEKDNAVKDAGRQQAAGAGHESLEIVPADPTSNTKLTLVVKGVNRPGAEPEWLVNGMTVPGGEGLGFKSAELRKGDTVQAKVTVGGREILSNIVEIKNAPPQLTRVKIMPEVFNPGDRLRVDASAEDPDGDDVTVRYEWSKNGEPAGDGPEIDDQVRRGDKVEVRIVPFDGETDGTPVALKREVGNMPPMIAEGGKFDFDGSTCKYRIKAADPDGDRLTYSLQGAPPGMTVDPGTGAIRWDVPPDYAGKVSCTAVVKDGHGGESRQNLSFAIKE